MNYCKKCMRILDEDSRTCVYCGNTESDETTKIEYVGSSVKDKALGLDADLAELDSLIEKNKQENKILQEVYPKTESKVMTPNPELFDTTASKAPVSEAMIIEDLPRSVAEHPRGINTENFKRTHDTHRAVDDERPIDLAVRVAMICVLLFMAALGVGFTAIGGIVMGAYLLSHKNRHYRSFGMLYLILSIAIIAIGFVVIISIS